MGRLSHIIIGIVLFSLVFMSGFFIFNDMNDYYGVSVDPEYTKIYDQVNTSFSEMESLGGDVQSKIETGEGLSVVENIVTLSSATYQSIKLVFNGINTGTTLISTISGKVGIPAIWINAFILLLGIVITFLILRALLRSEAV